MEKELTFKIGVYKQIAIRLNNAGLKHCAVHGIDYRQNLFGRDVDVMIRYQDRHDVRKIIKEVFELNGIRFKHNKFSWADWFIGYKECDDGNVSFIEIDLFYHINYRMIELTDSRLLGVSGVNDLFFVNDWQTYAKVVLIKFFGMNFEKLSERKFKEVQRVASLLRSENNNVFPAEFINELNEKILASDFVGLKELREQYPYISFAKKKPLRAVRIFFDSVFAMLHRKWKAFKIIPVMVLHENSKNVIDQYRIQLSKESFITGINETYVNGMYKDIFVAYWNYRLHSEPLALNVIYVKKISRLAVVFLKFLPIRVMNKDFTIRMLLHEVC